MPIARWLWVERSLSAKLVRLALLPPSLVLRTITAARASGYRARWFAQVALPAPTVSVGNLTVGGSGKTPIAAWIARYFLAQGRRPGILLRGYGGDEGEVHRNLVPEAIVVDDPNRIRGAEKASKRGADVLVLDDAYQRLDVDRDLNIAVVSAESGRAVPWTIPAGPWREGWRALRRADLVIVTRKRATPEAARLVARRAERVARNRPIAIARLGITAFEGMLSGERLDTGRICGAHLVAAAAVADPDSFAAQCRAMGATVRLLCWEDHHRFSERDVRRIADAAEGADRVVVTEKDAVKLRQLWPDQLLEPWVAVLGLAWERGGDSVRSALDTLVVDVEQLLSDSGEWHALRGLYV